MKRYFRVFCRIQFARTARELQLRTNFLLQNLGSLCFFTMHIIAFSIFMNKFTFPGWSTGQVWILLFNFEVFTYLCFFILYKGIMKTTEEINQATFDIILCKPMSARFVAFFRSGGAHNLVSAVLGIVALICALIYFHISTTLISWLTYGLLQAASVMILHNISVTLVSLNIRFGNLSKAKDIIFTIQDVYKYPATLYESGAWWHVIILAFAALNTFPVTMLIGKAPNAAVILTYLVLLIGSTIVSQYVWKTSLSSYTSG